MSMTINAGPRLDRLPISRFHWRLLALIGSGMLLDTFDINLASGVLGDMVRSGWSDLHHNAMFISATFAGMMLGAWFAGLLGDRYGRRFSYQFNLLLFGLASLAAAAAPTIDWLIAARFVTGLGLGAEVVVGYATFNEFIPPASRGRWAGALGAIGSSALFLSSIVALFVIPNFGWRWMFVPVGVGAIIVWYLRKSMPESPRWLEAVGRFDEAEAVLSRIEAEVARSGPLPPVAAAAAPYTISTRSTGSLFRGELLKRTIVGSVMMIGLNTVIYGFITWLPSFLVHEGVSINRSLVANVLMTFGGPVGTLIGLYLSDKWGRKPTLIVFSIVAGVLASAYAASTNPGLVTFLSFALVAAIYVDVVITWSLYVPELFPTDLRLRGAGFCNMIGRFATILTPYLAVAIFGRYGVIGVMVLLVGAQVMQVLVLATLGIETRQKSLELLAPAPVAEPAAFPPAVAIHR
jgi:MFS transporter, putative metabolite:H+ symporter